MPTDNFKQDILEVVGEERIEAIVVGRFPWNWTPDGDKRPHAVPDNLINTVTSWESVEALLDYTYSDGFGDADCHPVVVWTPSRVIYVDEYDGSTMVRSIPRHPVAHEVTFS